MARTKRISYTAPYTSPSFNNARALEFGGNFILSGMEVTDLGGYQIRVDIGALVNNGIIVELDASEDFSVPGITGADKYFYCYSPTSIEDQDLEFGLVDDAGWNSLYTLIATWDGSNWISNHLHGSIDAIIKSLPLSVGDGIISYGVYNGPDGIQEAIDSLAATGGKIFIKRGNYQLNQPVTFFSRIELEAEKGSLIIGPVDDYAFQVEGVSGIKLEQIEAEPNPLGSSPKNTINFSNVDSSWVVNCRATRRDNVYALELENGSNRSIFIGNDFETPAALGATDVMINAGCDDNIYVGNQDGLTNGGNNVIINKFISIPGDIGCQDVNPLGDISLVAGKEISSGGSTLKDGDVTFAATKGLKGAAVAAPANAVGIGATGKLFPANDIDMVALKKVDGVDLSTHNHTAAGEGGIVLETGTVMYFFQAAAPTAWTRVDPASDISILRIRTAVGGPGGAEGGNVAVENHIHTQPTHTHTIDTHIHVQNMSGSTGVSTGVEVVASDGTGSIMYTSTGGAGIPFVQTGVGSGGTSPTNAFGDEDTGVIKAGNNPYYMDVICASKD